MIDSEDLSLFQFADDLPTALRLLQTGVVADWDEGTPAKRTQELRERVPAWDLTRHLIADRTTSALSETVET